MKKKSLEKHSNIGSLYGITRCSRVIKDTDLSSGLSTTFEGNFYNRLSDKNVMTVCVVSGHVEAAGRSPSADHRRLSLRSGHSDWHRLQPTNERMEFDNSRHQTDGRGHLSMSD